MNAIAQRVAPSVTDLIRSDHTKVLGLFHRYKIAASPARKAALAGSICLALEVHAQAEEEVFYPAVRNARSAEKSAPEHDEMRSLIAMLRGMPSTSPAYAELHCLSHFSFQRGASSTDELFERAKKLGYAALAITDECTLAGVVRGPNEWWKWIE